MHEYFDLENVSYQEALEKAHMKNIRQSQAHADDIARLMSAREASKNRGKLSILLGSIATLAAGIAIYYRSEVVAAKAEIDIYKSADKDLKKIIEQTNITREKQAATHKMPPTLEQEKLLRGTEQEKIKILTEYLGEDYIRELQQKNAAITSEVQPDVTVTGSHEHMSAAKMRDYLKGYPSELIRGKVTKITIHQKRYGDKTSYSTYGETAGTFSPSSDSIDIFGVTAERKTFAEFDRVIAHELAHGNDWMNNEELTTTERINLLSKVLVRVMSTDRYFSSYVESIASGDKKTTLAHKCEEYFAVIIAAFLYDPSVLSWQDVQLADRLMSQLNPAYDVIEGTQLRVRSFTSNL